MTGVAVMDWLAEEKRNGGFISLGDACNEWRCWARVLICRKKLFGCFQTSMLLRQISPFQPSFHVTSSKILGLL